MKIKLVKKKRSMTVSFRAQNGAEGVDLKDVVMAMAKSSPTLLVTDAIDELGKRGYAGDLVKESPNVKDYVIKKAG